MSDLLQPGTGTTPFRVAGKWAESFDMAEPIPVVAPHTGEQIARIHDCGRTDVDRAVEAAYSSFEDPSSPWRQSTPKQRADALLAIANAVEECFDMFVDVEVRQTGKLYRDVSRVELPHVIDTLRFYAGAARTREFPSGHFMPGTRSQVVPAAVGVVGVITPFNYPLMMAAWKLGPILAAGCVAVFKPDERTPLSTLLLSELCEDILPPGTINVITGGRDTGQELAKHPGVHMVTFTGSQRGGKAVAETASGCLKRTHLELGGNCPVIIDASTAGADDVIPKLAEAITFNAGQSCAGPSRIYVVEPGTHTRVYDALLEDLAWQSEARLPGMPDDHQAAYGAVISEDAVERIEGFLTQSRGIRATREPDGSTHMTMQVVYDVPQGDPAEVNELFGPAVMVAHVTSPEEAIQRANGVPFGLAASIWSEDRGFVDKVARRLNAGEVWINTMLEQTPELPHSGTRQSGHGSDLSAAAIADFTYPKTITERITS